LVKIVEYKEIGKVSFVRKSAVRNLKITVKPFRGIQVLVPRFMSIESAGRFVEEKRLWIRQSQLKLARYEKRMTVFKEDTDFNTRDHVLILGRHEKSTIRTVIGQGQIKVNFPDFADISDPRIQNAIKKAILQAWRIEARIYLPERLQLLAHQWGLRFEKISVRDNKSRWGSCSRGNNISLNIHLMRLPPHLCDYVILHELTHTLHKHHQKAFWLYLNGLTGGKAKGLDKELNNYSTELW
jgi:predicted metal-dependent hydrolase